jgi:alpha-1,6-mannosyltransferase
MQSRGPQRLRRVLTATNLLLVGVACVSLVLYGVGLGTQRAGDITWFIRVALGQSILYLVAAWLVLRAAPARSTLVIALVFAALFRLGILFAPPYLSDDIYRYIWDGRVQAAHINPYRYIPADQALSRLRDDRIYTRINRRDYAHTIYPPVAEVIYLATTRLTESVTWMKATMVFFEGVACWALLGLLASLGWPRQRILIYAWSPLAVWEFAGSGHVDAAAIAFIALALFLHRRRMKTAAGVSLACAALVKLFPAVLLPALCRIADGGLRNADRREFEIRNSKFEIKRGRGRLKTPIAFAITLVIGYLPYLSVGLKGVLGFLPGYAKERGLVSGEQFYLLDFARRAFHLSGLPNSAFVGLAALILGGIAAWALRPAGIHTTKTQRHQGETGRGEKGKQPVAQDIQGPNVEGVGYLTRAFVLATAFTILLAPHFPWYFAWLAPFLCFLPAAPMLYLTVASFMLYATWLGDSPDQMFRLNSYLYIGCAFIGAISIWIRRHEWERY